MSHKARECRRHKSSIRHRDGFVVQRGRLRLPGHCPGTGRILGTRDDLLAKVKSQMVD